MTVTNAEIGAYVDALADVGTPASGDELLVYDVSATTTKKVLASALAGIGGNMSADTLWDAAGDLAVGTGANTGAKLTLGATGKVLVSNGSTAVWAYPPNYEFSYVEYTDLTTSHTSEGTADTVVASASIALDGSTGVFVEFFSPRVILATTAGALIVLDLYVDSTIQGRIAVLINPASAGFNVPVFLKSPKITPSNASHTFTVKAWHGTGAATVSGGAGGTGANVKGYIRVVRA